MDKPLYKKHIAHILEEKILEDGYDSVVVREVMGINPNTSDYSHYSYLIYNIEVDTRKEENDE